jgi:ankyrin repeat protein
VSPSFSKFAAEKPSPDGKLQPEKLTRMLVAAIIKNDAGGIASIVSMGVDLNRSDEKGNSPLTIAATDPRELGALRALLAAKADPNVPGANGKLPLHSLLRMKNERTIPEGLLALLAAKADPNLREALSGGRATPLQIALANERSDQILDLLLGGGADPCAGEDKGAGLLAPLHLLARSGRYQLLEMAFDRGAGVDTRDYDGRTCLIWAAHDGMTRTVETLLERGADPTIRDNAGQDAASRASSLPPDDARAAISRLLAKAARDFSLRAEIRELRSTVETLRRLVEQELSQRKAATQQ